MPAYYSAPLQDFLTADNSQIMDSLLREYSADKYNFLYVAAADAWYEEIPQLKEIASELIERMAEARAWTILIEFWIPRRRKRCDVVILSDQLVFVLEFKRT